MIKLHTLRSLISCISLTLITTTSLWSFHCGPYAGLALEYQELRGDRRDTCGFSEENGGGSQEFAPFQDFDSSQAGFEVFGGCLYPCFSDCFLMGFEGYLAYDFNKDTASEPLERCNQVSTVRRLFNTGVLFKAGFVVCEDYFIYGIVGPDIGYFKWDHHEEGKGKLVDKQALIGLRYGVGIEREFSCFRVGLQADYTHYNPKTFSARDASGDTPQSRIKPNILTVGLRFSVPLD